MSSRDQIIAELEPNNVERSVAETVNTTAASIVTSAGVSVASTSSTSTSTSTSTGSAGAPRLSVGQFGSQNENKQVSEVCLD